jgi:hypothetical protein
LATKAYRSFAGGELSPGAQANVDTVKYQTGLRTARNGHVKKVGGFENRAGTAFHGDVQQSSKKPRPIPVVISQEESYAVLLEENLLRVFSAGSLMTRNNFVVFHVSRANPAVVTVAAHPSMPVWWDTTSIFFSSFAFRENGLASFSGATGMTQINGNTYRIKNLTTTPPALVGLPANTLTFELYDAVTDVAIDSSAYGAYIANSARVQPPLAVTGISQANPCVVTLAGNGLQGGDEIIFSGIEGMTELNGRSLLVNNPTTAGFELTDLDGNAIDSTSFTAYTSGGTIARVLVVPHQYTEAQIAQLTFQQTYDPTSGPCVVIAHADHPVRRLVPYASNDWYLMKEQIEATIPEPSGLALSGGAGVGPSLYVVTAVHNTSFEETMPSAAATIAATASSANPITIRWDAVANAVEYNVYKNTYGIYGFIGVSAGFNSGAGKYEFIDMGVTPDVSVTPPYERAILESTGLYPRVVGEHQQRRLYGAPYSSPDTASASRIGTPGNFLIPTPNTDDAPLDFRTMGDRLSRIRHFVSARGLVVLTDCGEWIIGGDEAGILRPGAVAPEQVDYSGANLVRPVVVGGTVIYVQAAGSIVRALRADGKVADTLDLTTFASHLVKNKSIECLSWQNNPHSIVWAERDDGVLLGLTFVPEQELWGWHRHDTDDDSFESHCVVPEGARDVTYVVVKRLVDGAERRYLESFSSREVEDIVDMKFMDSHISYDGRNEDTSHTMTLSGGVTWAKDEQLTCTSSEADYFTADDVGNAIHIEVDDDVVRFLINEYVSPTVVKGHAHKTVPSSMRGVALSSWTRAVDVVSGLWHLEGRSVSILADGYVVASPNNPKYDEPTVVTNGQVELSRPYGVIHVGVPYISDLEMLDIQSVSSLSDKKMIVNRVTLRVEDTRGLFIGGKVPTGTHLTGDNPTLNLDEPKLRNTEGYDDPVALFTGELELAIQSHWNSNGRILIRQVDPLPMTVNSVLPSGVMPSRGS